MKNKKITLSIILLIAIGIYSFSRMSGIGDYFIPKIKGSPVNFYGPANLAYVDSIGITYIDFCSDTNTVPEYLIELQIGNRVIGTHSVFPGSSNQISFRQYLPLLNDSSSLYYGLNGNVNVTFYDSVNGIVRGKVDCVLKHIYSNDTLSISSGSFQASY